MGRRDHVGSFFAQCVAAKNDVRAGSNRGDANDGWNSSGSSFGAGNAGIHNARCAGARERAGPAGHSSSAGHESAQQRTESIRCSSSDQDQSSNRRPARFDRLLGFHRHRGLALPDDHAGQGRLSGRAAERRRARHRGQLGSGKGRSQRQCLQILRRRRDHARTHAAAHHLGG